MLQEHLEIKMLKSNSNKQGNIFCLFVNNFCLDNSVVSVHYVSDQTIALK